MKIFLKKTITYTVCFTFFINGITPAYAVINSIDDPILEEYREKFRKGVPLPASPDLRASAGETAAGVMIITRRGEELLALLGRRDDDGTWCNFGGKSEESHETLLKTAQIECAEESIGMYAFHPEELRKSPSHTLTSAGNPTYRMYIKTVDFQPAEVFLALLTGETDAHKKEYTDFRWVRVEELMAMVNGVSGAITSIEGCGAGEGAGAGSSSDDTDDGSMVLFPPMATMLRQPMVQAHLGRAQAKKPLRGVHTYNNDEEDPVSLWYAHYVAARGFRTTFTEGYQHITSFGCGVVSRPFTEDPWRSKLTFASTVVNKMLMQNQLLKTFPAPEPDPTPVSAAGAGSSAVEEFSTHFLGAECPTIRHLRLTLGESYVEEQGGMIAQRALLPNVGHYLRLLNDQKRMETRQRLKYKRHDVYRIAGLIQEEQRQWDAGKFPLYHGAEGNMGDLYASFSAIRSLLLGEDYSASSNGLALNAVRGSDIYFSPLLRALEERGSKTSIDVIHEHFKGQGDYDRERVTNRICTNPCLTTGPGLGQSTSNSLEYWLAAHSVGVVSAHQHFSGAMTLLGIPLAYDPIRSLFLQTYGADAAGNGMLAQVFVDRETMIRHAHAHHAYLGEAKTWGNPSHSDIASHFRELYGAPKKAETTTPPYNTRVAPEVWFYPVPGLMDTAEATIHRHHEVSEEHLKVLQNNLERLCCYGLSEWLAKEQALVPGSFHTFQGERSVPSDPRPQTLYQLAKAVVFGERTEFSPSPTALREIVLAKDPSILDTFVASDPRVEEVFVKNAQDYAKLAIDKEAFAMAAHIIERYLPGLRIYDPNSARSLLTLEELDRIFTKNPEGKDLESLLKNITLTHVPHEQKERWAAAVMDDADLQVIRFSLNAFGSSARKHLFDMIKNGKIHDNSPEPPLGPTLTEETKDSIDINGIFADHLTRGEMLEYYQKNGRPCLLGLLLDLGLDLGMDVDGYPLGMHFLLLNGGHTNVRLLEWFKSVENTDFLRRLEKFKALRKWESYPYFLLSNQSDEFKDFLRNASLNSGVHMDIQGVRELFFRALDIINSRSEDKALMKELLDIGCELASQKQGSYMLWQRIKENTLTYRGKEPTLFRQKTEAFEAYKAEQKKKVLAAIDSGAIDDSALGSIQQLMLSDQLELFLKALDRKIPENQLKFLTRLLKPALITAFHSELSVKDPHKSKPGHQIFMPLLYYTLDYNRDFLKHSCPLDLLEVLANSTAQNIFPTSLKTPSHPSQLGFDSSEEAEDFYRRIMDEGSERLKDMAADNILKDIDLVFIDNTTPWHDMSWITEYPELIKRTIAKGQENSAWHLMRLTILCKIMKSSLISLVSESDSSLRGIIQQNALTVASVARALEFQEKKYVKKWSQFLLSHGFTEYDAVLQALDFSSAAGAGLSLAIPERPSSRELPPSLDWGRFVLTDAMRLAAPNDEGVSPFNSIFRKLAGLSVV